MRASAPAAPLNCTSTILWEGLRIARQRCQGCAGSCDLSRSRRRVRIVAVGATKRRNLEQLYSGPQVLEGPLYSVFEASRYLQIPENTLRSWVSGRSYPLRSGASRRSDSVIELADPANSRLSFSNLTEAHVLDALRRQYQVVAADSSCRQLPSRALPDSASSGSSPDAHGRQAPIH